MRRPVTRGIGGIAILLLSLLGAGVAIPATPAGAQEQLNNAVHIQSDRAIRIRSPWGNCDWGASGQNYMLLSRGTQSTAPRAGWGCSNGEGYVVEVTVTTGGRYHSYGDIDITYGVAVEVQTPWGGTIPCGMDGYISNMSGPDYWWAGYRVDAVDYRWQPRTFDCGGQGSVSIRYLVSEFGYAWPA